MTVADWLFIKVRNAKGMNNEINANITNTEEIIGKNIISLSFFKTAKLSFTNLRLVENR